MAWKDQRQKEKRAAEDEMVRKHHRLSGHEFEQTLGDGEGQGSLACCRPWYHKELDTTEQLNNKIDDRFFFRVLAESLTHLRVSWKQDTCLPINTWACVFYEQGHFLT